jgi:HEAT repeat protein
MLCWGCVALLLLCGCGRRSPEYWMQKLENEPSEEQSKAALALGRMGADAKVSVPKLIKLLKEGDVQGRWSAAAALGQMGAAAQEAVPALKEALQDENGDVRNAAAEALERIERAVKDPKESP